MPVQPTLPFADARATSRIRDGSDLRDALAGFDDFGSRTSVGAVTWQAAGAPRTTPVARNEFWTRRQRAASRLHEISYRACFKPPLVRFFVDRLSAPGDVVHDPFMGRGTTVLEAALCGRVAYGSDVNPLSRILVAPRLAPPTLEQVAGRLGELDLSAASEVREELTVFFHPETLRAISALREHLLHRGAAGTLDGVDAWIRMVAVNRLTGHSSGFLSVYTLPPNQAVSLQAQRKINARRGQTPPFRDLAAVILAKSRSLLAGCDARVRERLAPSAATSRLLTAPADHTPELPPASVQLVVTSPPFLDVVQYAADNWLRCWFCGIDPTAVGIAVHRRVEDWQAMVTAALVELARLLRPGGWVAFEVGEVRRGRVRLEEAVLPCAEAAGLVPEVVLVNEQVFTKTANCWGVANNRKGTNTNRVVILRRP